MVSTIHLEQLHQNIYTKTNIRVSTQLLGNLSLTFTISVLTCTILSSNDNHKFCSWRMYVNINKNVRKTNISKSAIHSLLDKYKNISHNLVQFENLSQIFSARKIYIRFKSIVILYREPLTMSNLSDVELNPH